jgi:hypothetical protein
MYRGAGAGAGQPGGGSQPGPQPGGESRNEGDVIDAEVVEEEKR